MKKLTIGLFFGSGLFLSSTQNFEFQDVIDLNRLSVVSQNGTETCWSIAISSLKKSEIIRLTEKKIDLSEIYQVRTSYPFKVENYIRRKRKAISTATKKKLAL